MWRQLAKSGVAHGLRLTGADGWIGSVTGHRRRPLVVGYHRVVESYAPESDLPGMVIVRSTLERQLDWVGRRYRIVSLDELGAGLESGKAFETPMAAVTFDDGYSDVYHNALPLLRRKGIPATVFVVTDLVGTAGLAAYDRLYLLLARGYERLEAGFLHGILRALELPPLDGPTRRALARGPFPALTALLARLDSSVLARLIGALERDERVGPLITVPPELRPLDWGMVGDLRAAGIGIGSHTKGHALLTNEAPERVEEELAGSRDALEKKLGVAVRDFAYPDGRWNGPVVAATAAAGYRRAYTVCDHRHPAHPQLTIPRRMLWEGSCLDSLGGFSEAMMSCHVNGVFDLATRCPRNHGSAAPSRLGARIGA